MSSEEASFFILENNGWMWFFFLENYLIILRV